MSLIITTWRWGDKYAGHYVERLARGVARNLDQDYRFIVCQPTPEDEDLTKIPGCFARLRTFDPDWQIAHGIRKGDLIACLDLDMVVTGSLDPLFANAGDFAILQGVNAVNPCPYNGSFWTLRAGYRPDVWGDFSLAAASKVPWYVFPDDQSWMAHKLPGAGRYGPWDGVYGFQKPGWPPGTNLPVNARLVAFFGKRDPVQFQSLSWVKEHWS